MNKEELIGKLQMVYVGDRNALNELIGYYDGLKQGIEELQQESQQLKEINEEHKKLNGELREENKILKENAEHNDKVVDKVNWENMLLNKENKQLKDKLSKIETLIINHNCDTGDIYYKYNSKFLKSELKQRILEILEDKEVSE